MYLDGQLPGGPPSDNRGGQTSPWAISALFGNPAQGPGNPSAGANPMDTLDDHFYVVPNGGPVVVSPSLAKTNGIVQYPVTQPSTLYPPQIPIEPVGNACNGMSDYNPATLITPGAVPNLPVNQPVAPPQFTDTPSGRFLKPCPGYASDGSLVSLRTDSFRNGLAGCCQSGYQSYDNLEIPESSNWPWFLAAAAGLLILTTTKRGARG